MQAADAAVTRSPSRLTARRMVLALLLVQGLATAALAQVGARTGLMTLRATYGERGGEIAGDLVWRIYAVNGTEASLQLKLEQPRPSIALPAGNYAIHVSHGLATAIRQVTLTETGIIAAIPVNAGSLAVTGHLGGPERPLPMHRQRLRLFIPTPNNSEGRLVTDNLRPGTQLRLPEGTYHLVSTYSGSNSVVRTDVRIDTGKTTEAVVNHRAATMTLKLVRERGGAALAGAQWTIETPGGDVVAEALGAFPSVDIAEGSYNVTARHNDREYRGQMVVEGGVDRDFEIVVE
jgi:hypothetical protein